MKRKPFADSSPLYTPAKPLPGQSEIPVGTWHPVCAKCHEGFLCDSRYCDLLEPLCPNCSPVSHLVLLRQIAEQEEAAYQRECEEQDAKFEAQRAAEELERNRQIPLLVIERQPL